MGILNWLRRKLVPRDEDYFPDCQSFLDSREALLGAFHKAAIAAGKPGGLRWVSVEPVAEPVFAVSTVAKLLLAFWPVTVVFEPVPGSELEDVPQANGPREMIAGFAFRNRRWTPSGQPVLNVTLEKWLDANLYKPLAFSPRRTA